MRSCAQAWSPIDMRPERFQAGRRCAGSFGVRRLDAARVPRRTSPPWMLSIGSARCQPPDSLEPLLDSDMGAVYILATPANLPHKGF